MSLPSSTRGREALLPIFVSTDDIATESGKVKVRVGAGYYGDRAALSWIIA